MEPYLEKMGKEIVNVARRLNDELEELAGEGIFFMPELAFAFEVGKSIMKNAEEIFGGKPKWCRETDLGNGGPSDLIFEFDGGKKVVIEFKMRATGGAYLGDLEKLNKLDNENTAKIFCALVDVFSKDVPNDDRIKKVENFNSALVRSVLEPKPSFPTKQNWYSTPVSCLVGVWSVGQVPKL